MNGNIKPAVMFPCTTSPSVLASLMKHNVIMSSMRYRSERITMFGFPVGTEYTDAMSMAQGYKNERMLAVYPDGAIMGLVDEYGTEVEYVVDGTYLAAALVGTNVSLAYDVATPMTRKQVIGFKRLIRRLDEVEMDMTANSGITIIENVGAAVMLVRHCLTTDMNNAFTRELNVVTIKDYVQQTIRFALDRYIGVKYLPRVNAEIATTMNGVLAALVQAEIIVSYTGISVKTDKQDPTMAIVEAYYQPVVSLNFVYVTFNIRGKL